MDGDRVFVFIEQYAMITDSEPKPVSAYRWMASRMFSAAFCSIARTSSGTWGRKRIFLTRLLNRAYRHELGPW